MNTLKFLVNAKNADLMVTNSILLVQKNIPFSWQLRLKDAFKRPFKSVKCANERRRESSRKPPRFLIEKRKTQGKQVREQSEKYPTRENIFYILRLQQLHVVMYIDNLMYIRSWCSSYTANG